MSEVTITPEAVAALSAAPEAVAPEAVAAPSAAPEAVAAPVKVKKRKAAAAPAAPEAVAAPDAVATLALSVFNDDDDDDELDTEIGDDDDESAEPVKIETEDDVLKTVQTVDGAFANDPLKDDFIALVNEAREVTDPLELAPLHVSLGIRCSNILVKRFNQAPTAYSRKKAIKDCETALSLGGINLATVRPNDVIRYYWLVKLDRSTPPAKEGEPRSFADGPIPADWFAGNLRLSALKSLIRTIERPEVDDQLDVFEYKVGLEAPCRAWVKKLRTVGADGLPELMTPQVDAWYDFRVKMLDKIATAAAYAGKTQDEIASIEEGIKAETREKKLQKLGTSAIRLKKEAAALGYGKAELGKLLADKSVVPVVKLESPEQIAARMTPGDAKSLIQELMRLYASAPDRIKVLAVLAKSELAVRQLRALNAKLAAARTA
jgi:hypothetical protein